LGKRIWPGPDDPDRAEAALVPAVEIGEIGRERISALEVHDRGDLLRYEVARPPRDRQPEPMEDEGELVSDARGVFGRNRIVERKCVWRPPRFHQSVG